jgi:hypothetical protein
MRKVQFAPLFEAAHWAAVIFAGMLAVLFLSWAVMIAAPHADHTAVNGDPSQPIDLTF